MPVGVIHRAGCRAALVLCGAFFAQVLPVRTGWDAGQHPDPQKILDEAKEDSRAGRYADALAKYEWFHENALTYAPAMYGVRLSFALGAWVELGHRYPPALEKLRDVREKANQDARGGKNARHAFHDFAAINQELGEDLKTQDAFEWLDANQPAVAAEVFDIAQPSLVRAKKYRLCGKYLDPDRAFQRALRIHREEKEMCLDPEGQRQLHDYARRSFSNHVSTLVALLVQNGRKDEAERIVAAATKELTDEAFRRDLVGALNGEVPEPWP